MNQLARYSNDLFYTQKYFVYQQAKKWIRNLKIYFKRIIHFVSNLFKCLRMCVSASVPI